MSAFIDHWRGRTSTLPPIAKSFRLRPIYDPEVVVEAAEIGDIQSISGFVCIIEYDGDQRLITCQRFDTIGENGYVGAICHVASGYRQFRCDRIPAVYDASTGEVIGDGGYFSRFEVQSHRERAPTWGLAPSRKHTLICGLNVLAFMARCDGHWHPLENEPLERFICSMWLRKEWEGEPPLAEIVEHAQRLSPDAEIFLKGIAHYAHSATSTQILKRAIGDLIEADGVVHEQEITWAHELIAHFDEVGRCALTPEVEAKF